MLSGDLIELGVGAGGMSFLFGYLARDKRKKVFSLDSYEGLPEPHRYKDNPYFIKGDYRPSAYSDQSLIERFKLSSQQLGLTDIVTPIKGFFADTLPTLDEDQKFCMAHLDSDLYDSIYVSLEHVYDKVVEGGVIIFDDFLHPVQGPLRAAVDFFNSRGVFPVFHVSLPYSMFVFKGEQANPQTALRSVDGNVYSLEWLRSDDFLREILDQNLGQLVEGSRSYDNCKMFIELMDGEADSARDIYTYWRSLEDFWASMAEGLARSGSQRLPIQI